jgi:hypothetical protein
MQEKQMKNVEEFLEILHNTVKITSMESQKHNRQLDLARRDCRFRRYPVTAPWGAVWTGRKR